MSQPADQTPISPGQPQQPVYPAPPAGYVPAGPPAKPPNPKLVFWTSWRGILIMLGAVAVLFLAVALLSPSKASETTKSLDVDILSCTVTGDTATVGLSVTNTGKTAVRQATIHIEYRDGSGARIDTDIATVWDIPPGDTVRTDEQTRLDARTTSGSCHVAGIS